MGENGDEQRKRKHYYKTERKWLLGGICLQLATGYTVAFGIYQIGTLITTGSLGTAFVPGLIAVIVFALIILWRIRKSDKEFASEYSLHSVRS